MNSSSRFNKGTKCLMRSRGDPTPNATGGKEAGKRSHDIQKGVYHALVSWHLEILQIYHRYCQRKATMDVLGMCIYIPLSALQPQPCLTQGTCVTALQTMGRIIFISAWALCCSFLQYRAMQEPPGVGRVTIQFSRFFCTITSIQNLPIGELVAHFIKNEETQNSFASVGCLVATCSLQGHCERHFIRYQLSLRELLGQHRTDTCIINQPDIGIR